MVAAILTAVLTPVVTFWLEHSESSTDSLVEPVADTGERDPSGGGGQGRSLVGEPAPRDRGDVSRTAGVDRGEPPPAQTPPPAGVTPGPDGLWTLAQGKPLRLSEPGVTLSVTFSDELGAMATLRIQPAGGKQIVEAVLGPGGQIPFHTRSGNHSLSVVDWNPAAKTLILMIE